MKLLIVPGILALGGLLITQMDRLNSARAQQLDKERLELDRQLSRRREITNLFTHAIDQLGATDSIGNRNIETRVGAIYALERIAWDSRDPHWPIVEILTSYVRQHAPRRLQEDQERAEDVGSTDAAAPDLDIQAILTVLGRRSPYHRDVEYGPIDLHDTYLRGANLWGAYLEGAYLTEANLQGANLTEANLQGADLRGTFLTAATMPNGQKYEDWREDGETTGPS